MTKFETAIDHSPRPRVTPVYPLEPHRRTTMANPLDDLSKRELFAAFALMGAVSQPENFSTKDCAERAVQAADALIAELTKRPEK
jgi:hypothetical protein